MGTLHEDRCAFLIWPRWIIIQKTNVSDRSREYQNTQVMFNKSFPRKSCIYETCEKERVRFWVSTVPMVTPTCLNITLHVHLLILSFHIPVEGSIPDGVFAICHLHNPSSRTMALGLTQPLTEMSTSNTSWA